ncbi:hypothetical protein KYK29_18245 [Shinella daejeonensis]|uniref:hypothetical protein n=1 Tax=Shinella daejeonensis TaxID=659017 RepID=UPI0020C7C15C|nr:hypothetical protein [Shinella daejeonensis]MCP8896871.1 hypothetical protein [Shinella daejeonensis]
MLKKIFSDNAAALILVFVLFMVAIPLVSVGSTQSQPALSGLGGLILIVAAAIPPARRFMVKKEN